MFRITLQSGLRAVFFLAVLLGAQIAAAQPPEAGVPDVTTQSAELAQNPVWQALLHLDHGRPTLDDAGFLLSRSRFSPRAELEATVAALYGPESAQMLCRFPARYVWLKAHAQLPVLDVNACTDLQEFVQRAPADRMWLVLASENLAQPASMMGHIFFKLEGVDAQGQYREHAVSFFTDTASLNLPKLLFDSLVVGKKGHFALAPYADEAAQYLRREQRTLWEYELKLDAAQRRLLQYHLIELKQSTFTYFFDRYNCATLIKHIAAVNAPAMLAARNRIDTPKDVVKRADAAGAFASSVVRAPSRWQVRALASDLPADQADRVRRAVLAERTDVFDGFEPGSRQGFLAVELAQAYHQYRVEQGDVVVAAGRSYRQVLEGLAAERYPGYTLQATARRDPLQSPMESQVRVGLERRAGRPVLTLGVLPVSHTLDDDNTTYFSENELRLFDAALKIDLESRRIRLDRLTIYAAKSVLARDAFTGGWSGQIKLGWEPQPDGALQERTAFVVEAGGGAALRPLPDLDTYTLLSVGLGVRQGAYAYAKPEIGAILREVYGMKSQLVLSHTHRPLGQSAGVTELTFTQSKYLDQGYTLLLHARRRLSVGHSDSQLGLTLKRLF